MWYRFHMAALRSPAKALLMAFLLISFAHSQSVESGFPPYLRNHFDFASFARYQAPAPPRPDIYQSNGFFALQENGFGAQRLLVPLPGDIAPDNTTGRQAALELQAPELTLSSGRQHKLDEPGSKHDILYLADRTVYRSSFDGGLRIALTVYPVYGRAVAVARLKVLAAPGPVGVSWSYSALGFARLPEPGLAFAPPNASMRVLIGASRGARPLADGFQWKLRSGEEAVLAITSGANRPESDRAMAAFWRSPDRFERETHLRWNAYLASVPLVAPAAPLHFRIGGSGEQKTITPEELVRSEIWFWRGLLMDTCQVASLPAAPLTIADWNVFFGMWGNDGVEEAVALSGTGRADLARGALLNWFSYAVNTHGDGSAAWTLFPSGKSTYQADQPVRATESVPLQAHLVGEYVRLTGDVGVLDEKLPGGRSVWQALLAYENHLLSVRDINGDGLIDWTHIYETGWDDKNSPFVDQHGDPTTAVNEQVFHLWSLREMAYLARLKGEDASVWDRACARTLAAAQNKLWDKSTQRYWDLDVKTGALWTKGENLDAYYLLYFERNPARIDAMMKRLRDPAKFDAALWPTMALDTPNWGGYWRGPTWPRIFGYMALALQRSGYGEDGFLWLARAIHSNLGPLLPESVDPRAYPPGESLRKVVRVMGYDAIDTLIFPELAGLRTWGGEDLTVLPPAINGKVYVRSQHWMGDRYDALFERGHATRLSRNGKPLPSLDSHTAWRARKTNAGVRFDPLPDPSIPVPR